MYVYTYSSQPPPVPALHLHPLPNTKLVQTFWQLYIQYSYPHIRSLCARTLLVFKVGLALKQKKDTFCCSRREASVFYNFSWQKGPWCRRECKAEKGMGDLCVLPCGCSYEETRSMFSPHLSPHQTTGGQYASQSLLSKHLPPSITCQLRPAGVSSKKRHLIAAQGHHSCIRQLFTEHLLSSRNIT